VIGELVSGAVFNLNEPAHYVHWHFFDMSVANLAVIIATLAVLLPFPGARRRAAARRGQSSSATGNEG
jgi:hypothetical protein